MALILRKKLANKLIYGWMIPIASVHMSLWRYILASEESSIPMKFYVAIQNQQFMVTSFVVNWCKNHFISEFQRIKDPYLPKAKEFGLVL